MEKKLRDFYIAVDFDSTISHYDGFKGVGVFGKPVQGAAWALGKFREMGATVIIHTCRREINLIAEYLKEHNIQYDYINYSPKNSKLNLSNKKIAATVYIDDKAIGFRGQWRETYLDVVNFRRWEHEYGAISSKG